MKIINSIIFMLIYLGIGALVHGHFVGQVFMPENVMSWGFVLAWPAALLWIGLKWAAIALAVLLVIALIIIVIAVVQNVAEDSKTRREVALAKAARADAPKPGTH